MAGHTPLMHMILQQLNQNIYARRVILDSDLMRTPQTKACSNPLS